MRLLGDTFVRMLRARGNQVEVQNYIDNTGVQVADVVAGFHFLEKKDAGRRARADRRRRGPLRLHLLGSLRAHVAVLQGQSGSYWHGARRRCMRSKPAQANWRNWRIWWPTPSSTRTSPPCCGSNIQYDVLPRESEILHLQFWAAAFELLKERKAIYFEDGRQEQRLLGDAVRRLPRRGRSQ